MNTELDRVALAIDLPAVGLRSGDLGTVVHVYPGGEFFEVEFFNLAGETIDVVTLKSGRIRALEEDEVAHARRLPKS